MSISCGVRSNLSSVKEFSIDTNYVLLNENGIPLEVNHFTKLFIRLAVTIELQAVGCLEK